MIPIEELEIDIQVKGLIKKAWNFFWLEILGLCEMVLVSISISLDQYGYFELYLLILFAYTTSLTIICGILMLLTFCKAKRIKYDAELERIDSLTLIID